MHFYPLYITGIGNFYLPRVCCCMVKLALSFVVVSFVESYFCVEKSEVYTYWANLRICWEVYTSLVQQYLHNSRNECMYL